MRKIVRSRTARRRAFTLLEVLMVVVIIGVLAAFVVPNFFSAGEKAKKDMTANLIKSGINGTLDLYRMHMGEYPESLEQLVTPPDDAEIAEKWAGPYVKDLKNLKDSWGNDLIYTFPGRYNETSYDLSSPGANKKEGDDDDITNWDRA